MPPGIWPERVFCVSSHITSEHQDYGFSLFGQKAVCLPQLPATESGTRKDRSHPRGGPCGPDGCQPPAAAPCRRRIGGRHGAPGTLHRDFGAPLAIIVCADTNEVWTRKYDGKKIGDIDASIVTDHMMLAAASLGLDTLWICMFKPEAVREEFALPEGIEPVNILLVGYGAGEPASPERHAELRKPLAETVFHERFGQK